MRQTEKQLEATIFKHNVRKTQRKESSNVGRLAQSVQIMTTGQTVHGSNPGGARFSAVQTGPGAHPAPCTMRTGSFPGVKYGRGVTLTPHPLLVQRSENNVELYLYSKGLRGLLKKGVKPTYLPKKPLISYWITKKGMVQANIYTSMEFERRHWVSTFWMGNSGTIRIIRGTENDHLRM